MSAAPVPAAVLALREAVQARLALGITAAQDRCAAELHTSRRAWQQWERGDRAMHPALWDIARLRVAALADRRLAKTLQDALSTGGAVEA